MLAIRVKEAKRSSVKPKHRDQRDDHQLESVNHEDGCNWLRIYGKNFNS